MTESETYSGRIGKNSFWAFISFAITSICSFIISIELTHLFGKEIYGNYSFFIWLCGILSVAGGFGLSQSATKFLPELYFNKNPKIAAYSKNLLLTMMLMQIVLASIISFLAIWFLPQIAPSINIDPNLKPQIFALAALTILPLSLNAFFASSYAAIQKFARLAKIQITANFINLLIVSFLAYQQSDIASFIWIFLIFNSFYCLLYFSGIYSKPQLQQKPIFLEKKFIQYSLWNYLTTIANQIVWGRSEIFFLAIYSNSGQIAVYSLAYALSILFTGLFGTVNTVFNYTAAELIANNNTEKLGLLSRHSVKYLAMISLPALIISSFLMKELIILVYGEAFIEAALLFPILTFAQIINIILSPLTNVPNLSNEAKRITTITALTATTNIILDFILIPKFAGIGAAFANIVSQIFALILLLFNIHKYRLGIFNKYLYRIFGLNLGIITIFILFENFNLNFSQKLLSAIIVATIYILTALKIAFEKQDIQILKNLCKEFPLKIQKPLRKIIGLIENIMVNS